MRSLELVQFVNAENDPTDGLVSVRKPESVTSPYERAILLQTAIFTHVDYVFFRRFQDADGRELRSPQVVAYVVDNSTQNRTEQELASLHHKLWLHGVSPLIYVAWPTRIDILTCARTPDFWVDGEAVYREAERIEFPKSAIQIASEISDTLAKRKRFSAYRLIDGTFWDDPDNQKLSKESAAAHRSLIQAIVEADKTLQGATHPIRRRMLVLMVLIKYLEDRGVFPPGHFGNYRKGARSFRDMLRQGSVEEVLRLLKYFENKFNGDVFTLNQDGDTLTETELRSFATLVEADVLGGQRHFWELFSFAHIPVEVISRLYQQFVTGNDAVYTPPFLASLILDQVMPYDRMTGKEKVLDPACGSGIFLVGAFKRLVIHWRSTHDWQKPTADDLKRILADSIYGVELESGAVDLTAFSLALAVCDALEPPVIWSGLKFDKLRGRNLRDGDFFDPATFSGDRWPEKFDVVVGNPPFESKLTAYATAVEVARPKNEPKLPDKQVAYLFLERGLKSLVPGGSLCLIQPYGILYNSGSVNFHQHLMSLCCLHSVLDFVSIRGLFDRADTKSVAWHAVNEPISDQSVDHLVFRRTYSAFEQLAFEIDHYDWHLYSQAQIKNPLVWRAGLLGGGRLLEISDRLRKMTNLKIAIDIRKWVCKEGFIAGTNGEPCEYLTGQPYLPTNVFTENYINPAAIEPLTKHLFVDKSVKEAFETPLILIKKNANLPIAFWNSNNLTYKSSIVGIHAPKEEENELKHLYYVLARHQQLYRFCVLLIGTRLLTGRATAVNKQDIDNLPFPDDLSELDLSFWEDALKEDVINHMADYIRLGQDSKLLKSEAKLSDLREYSALYVRMLGSLYDNLRSHEPIVLNGIIAQPFYFGEQPDTSWLGEGCEEPLQRLIYDTSREALRTVRVVRYYEKNVILIVKPDRLRFWIRSTAVRDADDTLTDLRQQGW